MASSSTIILRRAILGMAALLAGSAAQAQDGATRAVGAWTVSPSSDAKGCFITRTYSAPRGTTLQFGVDIDGSNRLTLLNGNWSIRPRDTLKLDYRLSGAAFPRHLSVGIAADRKKGFVTTFGPAFPRTFATSSFLHVKRGSVPVEELSLDGSGPAIAALRTCVDRFRTAPRPGGKPAKGAGRIPLDPFASKAESRQ